MTTEAMSGEEICRLGQQVVDGLPDETVAEHNGRMIAVDAATGDYEIGDHRVSAAERRLRQRRPQALVYWGRIGERAAYHVGGSQRRGAR